MPLFRQMVIPHSQDRPLSITPAREATGRITAIDGMRAMAMLMVYLYHTWEFGGSPQLRLEFGGSPELRHTGISFGAIINGFPAGVDLFMVLSGFCLFWPLVSKPGLLNNWKTGDFAVRRIRRIFPPYLASMVIVSLLPNTLVCIFKLAHLQAKWQQFPSLWQYATHLTFTHTLFPGTWDGIQGAYWSLALEAQLYVVFPLVIWGFRRMGMNVLLPMVLMSLVYRGIGAVILKDAGWTVNFLYSVTFLGRWMEFAAGMLAAWIVVRRRNSPLSAFQGTMLCIAAALNYSVAVSHLFPEFDLFSLREVLLSLSFGSLAVAMCASRTSLRAVLENRVMVFLGLISYSIFLLHQNTMYYFGEMLKKVLHFGDLTRFEILITIGFALTISFSYAFYRVFEHPFVSSGPKPVVQKRDQPIVTSDNTQDMSHGLQRRDAVA